MSKFAILIGCYTTTSGRSLRPSLTLFFDKLFKSISTKHQYRVIFSDDGSTPDIELEATNIAKKYPIETHFRGYNVGECRNFHYMAKQLKDEDYVFYLSNDCFIRNLDNVDWLDTMKQILDETDCTVSTLQAGYPSHGEWSWTPHGKYQKFGYISTRHFMMTRKRFDSIDWNWLLDHIDYDPIGATSWEAWISNYFTPVTTLGAPSRRLGIWHVALYCDNGQEKVRRICETDDDLPF